jgi:hypothetical protein
MNFSIRMAVCLVILLPARAALAGDDSDIGVDVVVNMTNEGRNVPPPTPDHPAYYYPVTRGYTEGGAILTSETAPPPTADVQHMIAKALASQGYLLATRHPPSLVLILWWGYKSPELMAPPGESLPEEGPTLNLGAISGGPTARIANSPGASIPGFNFLGIPPNLSANHSEMEELVFGSEYEPEPMQNLPSIRLEALINASRVSRYFLIVSALDFKAATEKRAVLLWTARVSTSQWGHSLDQVLPTLVATGAPMFGRDSYGPHLAAAPIIPMGQVVVGTPVIKISNPGPQ